jgi:hypothetical protein
VVRPFPLGRTTGEHAEQTNGEKTMAVETPTRTKDALLLLETADRSLCACLASDATEREPMLIVGDIVAIDAEELAPTMMGAAIAIWRANGGPDFSTTIEGYRASSRVVRMAARMLRENGNEGWAG